MNSTIYLAGPISGLDFAGANGWRAKATQFFADRGIKALNPLRNSEYLAALKVLSPECLVEGQFNPLSRPRGVMTRDHFDATRCTAMLVNLLGSKTVSIGTVMEIAWSFEARIPLVCAMEVSGNPHEHCMVNEAIGFRAETIEDALALCVAVVG